MSKYVSRKYLSEKWRKLKYDMEKYLEIENTELDDKVDEENLIH